MRMTHHKVHPAERTERLKFWRDERARSIARGQIAERVPYHEELSGPNGMSFLLLPLPGQSADDIQSAARRLMRDRDVVRMSHFQPNELESGEFFTREQKAQRMIERGEA